MVPIGFKLKSLFLKCYGHHHDMVDSYGIPLSQMTADMLPVVSSFRSYHVTRLTRQVPLVEQELLILPEHLSSPPFFCGVRVTRSLVVLCVCFEDHYLSFCTFSFSHCAVDLRILITLLVS